MIDKGIELNEFEKKFKSEIEIRIKAEYELRSIEAKSSESVSDEGYIEITQRKTDLSMDIKHIIEKLCEKDKKSDFIISNLFKIFIKCVFKLRPEDQELIYTLGNIYTAFKSIQDFNIDVKTINFIKQKFLLKDCNYTWIDIITLDNFYKEISPIEDKELKFRIRNLILLSLNKKQKNIDDIKII